MGMKSLRVWGERWSENQEIEAIGIEEERNKICERGERLEMGEVGPDC